MAYAKWELDHRNTYQLCIGVHQAALILVASETDREGPFEMAYEATGVGGWDDILVFSSNSGVVQATHYQVKDQLTDFEYSDGESALGKYFQEASDLLSKQNPYGSGTTALTEHRQFVLGFPHLSIGLQRNGHRESLPFNALHRLAEKCRGPGSPHVQIASTKGLHLGKPNEQAWLEFVKNAVGDWSSATTILRQFAVQSFGDQAQIRAETHKYLGLIWKCPEDVIEGIEQAVRKSNPSSRIRTRDLCPFVVRYEQLNPSPRFTLCRRDREYYFRRGDDIHNVVACVWKSSNADRLCVDFASAAFPEEDLAVRTEVLRLGLHTSGITAVEGHQWWAAAREGLRGALGTDGEIAYTDVEFFKNKLPSSVVAPHRNDTLDVSLFHAELNSEMDQWLWARVDEQVRSILTGEATTLRKLLLQTWASFSSQIKPAWRIILRKLLKAACEGESVKPELRAGPRMVTLLAQTLIVATVLHAFRNTSQSASNTDSIGTIGGTEILGLALEKISVSADVPGGVELWRRARELLTGTGLLVLGSKISTADLDESAQDRLTGAAVVPPGLGSPASPVAILSFEPSFRTALRGTDADLRNYIERRIKKASKATRAEFAVALQVISEQEEDHAA